jgi:hypothetical protein
MKLLMLAAPGLFGCATAASISVQQAAAVSGGNLVPSFACLAGCDATGARVTATDARQFQVGKTTFDEVTDKLGRPGSTSIEPDGSLIAIYRHLIWQTNYAMFIPLIGLATTHPIPHTTQATFQFDADGLLTGYSVNDDGRVSTDLDRSEVALPPGVCEEEWATRCRANTVETCRSNVWRTTDTCDRGSECSEASVGPSCGATACCHY